MQIWEVLMKGVLQGQFTGDWESLIQLTTLRRSWSKINLFVTRYMMQATVHALWMERNRRKHDEKPTPNEVLVRRLDKNMRNVFTIMQRRGNKELAGGMVYWFSTR